MYKVVDSVYELDDDVRLGLKFLTEALDAQEIPWRVFETYRSQERQNYLYEQGRTRPGNIVTWTRSSIHTTRRAFDIVHPELLWSADESYWRSIALVGRKVGFDCGYFWGYGRQDKPHFQLDKGAEVRSAVSLSFVSRRVKTIRCNGKSMVVDVLYDSEECRNFVRAADLMKLGFSVSDNDGVIDIGR